MLYISLQQSPESSSKQKAFSVVVYLHLFSFSQEEQPNTACCTMSENSCFLYFLQCFSCLWLDECSGSSQCSFYIIVFKMYVNVIRILNSFCDPLFFYDVNSISINRLSISCNGNVVIDFLWFKT